MGPLARVLILTMLLNFPLSSSEGRENNSSAQQRLSKGSVSQPPALWSRLSERLTRRAACDQQARERGLSGRMARRYTRLCLSELPVPKPLRRSP